MTTCAVILALVAGVGAGWLLRGWWDTRHTRRMRPVITAPFVALARFVNTYSRRLGLVLVVIALGSNALVGFLQIQNGAADDARDRRIDAFVKCSREYNIEDGKARDERAAVASSQTAAAIAWLGQLRDGVRRRNLSAESLDRSIAEYERTLKATQDAQIQNPYPDPDKCGGLPK